MESDVYMATAAALGFHFVFGFKKIIRESLVLTSWKRWRRRWGWRSRRRWRWRGPGSKEDVNRWCQCVSGGLH